MSTAGKYDSSIFSLLRNLYTGFHSGCTYLYFNYLFPLHSYRHLLLIFFIKAILIGVRKNLNEVLNCISFVAKDVVLHEFLHVFMHHLHYFENHLFSSFAHLLIVLYVNSMFNFFSLWLFWLLIILQVNSSQKLSPILQSFVLFLLLFPWMCRSFVIWCNATCQYLFLFFRLLESYSESWSLCLQLQVFSLCFFLAVWKLYMFH
jgi:hypothetical protein